MSASKGNARQKLLGWETRDNSVRLVFESGTYLVYRGRERNKGITLENLDNKTQAVHCRVSAIKINRDGGAPLNSEVVFFECSSIQYLQMSRSMPEMESHPAVAFRDTISANGCLVVIFFIIIALLLIASIVFHI